MSARMVLLGPPGAGKGTQAARISERLSVPAISTGDIFRANAQGETELGKRMVKDRLAAEDAAQGFLLDGYPRTEAQVHELDAMLAEAGLALDVVLEITADAEVVVERLLKRATEQNRADDTESVIRRRLEVYAEQTEPLASLYEARGLLVRVDGIGDVDEVTERMMAALAARTTT